MVKQCSVHDVYFFYLIIQGLYFEQKENNLWWFQTIELINRVEPTVTGWILAPLVIIPGTCSEPSATWTSNFEWAISELAINLYLLSIYRAVALTWNKICNALFGYFIMMANGKP